MIVVSPRARRPGLELDVGEEREILAVDDLRDLARRCGDPAIPLGMGGSVIGRLLTSTLANNVVSPQAGEQGWLPVTGLPNVFEDAVPRKFVLVIRRVNV